MKLPSKYTSLLASRKLHIFLLIGFGVLCIFPYLDIATRFVFDDAYITFRYSMNLAEGYGLVWNIGQPPEEGFTSLFHVLLIAIPSLFTNDPLVASQVINVIATFLTAVVMYSYGRHFSRTVWIPLIASAVFLAAPITWANALSGMETSLFALFLIFGFYLAYVKERIRYAYVVALMAGLTRPEGFLLGFLLVLVDCVRLRRLEIREFVVYFLVPLVAYAIIKTLYFGYLLPNPFIFKATPPGHEFTFFGVAYVKMFTLSILPALAIAFALFIFKQSREIVGPMLLILALCAFYTKPAPLMGFHDRFLFSAFTLTFAVASLGGLLIWRWKLVVIPVLALLALQGFVSRNTPRARESLSSDHTSIYHVFKEVGKILRELPDHRRLTLATTEAGYLPFWSQLTTYDIYGLNTRAFAKEKNPIKNIDLLFSLRPDVLALLALKDSGIRYSVRQVEHGMSARTYHRIPDHPDFSNYREIAAIPYSGTYFLTILARKETDGLHVRERLLSGLRSKSVLHDSTLSISSP